MSRFRSWHCRWRSRDMSHVTCGPCGPFGGGFFRGSSSSRSSFLLHSVILSTSWYMVLPFASIVTVERLLC